MSLSEFTTDDIAAAKRFLIDGYGVNETADALGLGRQQLRQIAAGRTYRQVQPLGRHRAGSGLLGYVVRRDARRLQRLELEIAIAEGESELAALRTGHADTRPLSSGLARTVKVHSHVPSAGAL